MSHRPNGQLFAGNELLTQYKAGGGDLDKLRDYLITFGNFPINECLKPGEYVHETDCVKMIYPKIYSGAGVWTGSVITPEGAKTEKLCNDNHKKHVEKMIDLIPAVQKQALTIAVGSCKATIAGQVAETKTGDVVNDAITGAVDSMFTQEEKNDEDSKDGDGDGEDGDEGDKENLKNHIVALKNMVSKTLGITSPGELTLKEIRRQIKRDFNLGPDTYVAKYKDEVSEVNA
jgi:hypothetical protein